MRLRCGGIFNDHFVTRSLLNPTAKELWKSANVMVHFNTAMYRHGRNFGRPPNTRFDLAKVSGDVTTRVHTSNNVILSGGAIFPAGGEYDNSLSDVQPSIAGSNRHFAKRRLPKTPAAMYCRGMRKPYQVIIKLCPAIVANINIQARSLPHPTV